MKRKQFKHVRKAWLLCSAVLPLAACIDGYDGDKTWSVPDDAKNITMRSPAPEDVTITFNADKTQQTIEWPLSQGAGGYEVSVYIVDDPDNPVLVGNENEIVDGLSVRRDAKEDTKYKVRIKTLGNQKYNNTDAASPSEKEYDNMLPVYAVIPTGTDLTQYFTENPVPASTPETPEVCYELELGGSYTMTGDVSTGLTPVTIRGGKAEHAQLTMTNGAFVNGGAGFTLKFVDIDCSGFASTAVILFNATLPADDLLNANGYAVVSLPIFLQSCKITGLSKKLIYNNKQKYALTSLQIKDCIIGQNLAGNEQLIRFETAGHVNDLKISNSTFYNETTNGNYFIQLQGGKCTDVDANWVKAKLTIENSTFYQIVKNDQMGNYANNFAQKNNEITIQRCIFVDCGNKAVVRRLGGGNANATVICGFNSYWYDGAFVDAELTTTPADNSGTHFTINPDLKAPANRDFTPQGAAQVAAKTGDPRWLDDNIWK